MVLLFAACSSKSDDYTVPPGGGGGGGGGGGNIDAPAGSAVDAPVAKLDAGFNDAIIPADVARVPGRVCKLSDPRKLRTCDATGAGGYTVRLGSATALTSDDGSFEIDASGGPEWVVLGGDIETSHRPFGDYQIPVMPKTLFASLLAANSISPIPGEGTIMADVLKDAIGHPNCVAETIPVSPDGELYDTGSTLVWGRAATGTLGAVFVPGVVESGMASIKVTPPAPEKLVTISMAVYDGAITFVTVPIE
jgi:hypothetical protein